MSQHDFNIANQTTSAFRADLNNALTALASLSSGATAPATTFANMLWYDTANNLLKKRTEADDGWTTLGTIDEGNGTFTQNSDTVELGNWTITESAGVLYFATGGTNKMKLDASGNLTVVGNVSAYGTV